ncbi:MAG TPA: DUF3375 domain-containing protein [Luteimicrobium sp.]|nr:DUF3375 domain-containing protein [Luteimicrobium sp.]
MARVEGAYERARRAFASPMLALLHKQRAPLVVTLLGALFGAERSSVPVADAHTELDDALAGLRAGGFDDVPDASARELCRQWVAESWLLRQVGDDGAEEYRLTAHAVEALEVAARAGGPRTRVSHSRIRTLLEAVEHLAQEADPDVENRVARVEREIERLTAERDRLRSGAPLDLTDDDQLVEEAENVLFLVRELPADFARVGESIKALQRGVVEALRQDQRPTGEVLEAYLEQAERLLDATPEGRAFAGAMRLLADTDRLDALADQLGVVLEHPFAQHLDPERRAELRAITRQIEAGLGAVLTQQRRTSHIITTQVRHHDPLRDRQVDDLLRDAVAALGAWFPGSRRGQDVEALRRLPRADVGRLRETPYTPGRAPAPDALAVWDDGGDAGAGGDLEDARAWGGPHYGRIAARLAARAGDPEPARDLAELFESGPADLRRPVDLLGYLELVPVAAGPQGGGSGEVSVVTAVRPDGTTRRLAFARTHVDLDPAPPADPAPHAHDDPEGAR